LLLVRHKRAVLVEVAAFALLLEVKRLNGDRFAINHIGLGVAALPALITIVVAIVVAESRQLLAVHSVYDAATRFSVLVRDISVVVVANAQIALQSPRGQRLLAQRMFVGQLSALLGRTVVGADALVVCALSRCRRFVVDVSVRVEVVVVEVGRVGVGAELHAFLRHCSIARDCGQ
jgi:hypothetical protein